MSGPRSPTTRCCGTPAACSIPGTVLSWPPATCYWVHGRRARSHPVRGGDSPLRLCALQERHFGGRGEGGGRPPQDRLRSGPTARGRNFTPNLVATRTGDVFEIYVRHDIGAEVYLSSKDIDLPDDPQFAAPTANYFMGMYEAH